MTKRHCRFEGCQGKHYGKEFCRKHYSWLRQGCINEQGDVLITIKTPLCIVKGCPQSPAKKTGGLCRFHFEEETVLGYRLPRRSCTLCGSVGKLTKNLCPKHYSWLCLGLIDAEGNSLRDIKHKVYNENERCRALDKERRCSERPQRRGFCDRHYNQWQRGAIDTNGKPLKAAKKIWCNQNVSCRFPDCTAEAYCLGYCRRHYRMYLRQEKKKCTILDYPAPPAVQKTGSQ